MATERIQRLIADLLDQAEQAVKEGRWRVVKRCAETVLALDADNADALLLMEALKSRAQSNRFGLRWRTQIPALISSVTRPPVETTPGATQTAAQEENSVSAAASAVRQATVLDEVLGLLSRFNRWITVAILLLVGLWFGGRLVNRDPEMVPDGVEWAGNTLWIEPAISALKALKPPLWDHARSTGYPLLGDPFSHLFSPLALLPALLFGAVDGPRFAVFLTVIASGLTQYYFARVLKLPLIPSLIAAIAYMLNGHMLARFGYGHFDFGLAFPYIPLTFALTLQAIQNASPMRVFLASMALALLAFCGNTYYVIFALPGFAVLAAFCLIPYLRAPASEWPVFRSRLLTIIAIPALALGLAAVQLLPWVATEPLINKPADPHLIGSPTIEGSLRSLFTKDLDYFRSGVDGIQQPFFFEYYSYVSIFLLPLIVLSPLVLTRRRDGVFALCFVLFALYILWSSAAHTPFKYAYEIFPRLYELRSTPRALAFALPFATLLAGLGAQAFVSIAAGYLQRLRARGAPDSYIALAPSLILSTLLIAVTLDMATANRNLFHYRRSPAPTIHEQMAGWLEENTDEPFIVDAFDGTWGVPTAYRDAEAKLSRSPWGWRMAPEPSQVFPDKPKVVLDPPPKYFVRFANVPPEPSWRRLKEASDRVIYVDESAPPYAGFIRVSEAAAHLDSLLDPKQPGGYRIWPFPSTTKATASWPDTNSVRVTGRPEPGNDRLLVLETYVEGWRVTVDGIPGIVHNVGGLVAAEILPGEHTYLFEFRPAYFGIGLAISVLTLIASTLAILWGQRSMYPAIFGRLRVWLPTRSAPATGDSPPLP